MFKTFFYNFLYNKEIKSSYNLYNYIVIYFLVLYSVLNFRFNIDTRVIKKHSVYYIYLFFT